MYPIMPYKALLSISININELQIKRTVRRAQSYWMQGWGACGGYSTSDAQKRPVLSTPTQPWSSNVGTPIARHS